METLTYYYILCVQRCAHKMRNKMYKKNPGSEKMQPPFRKRRFDKTQINHIFPDNFCLPR